MRLYLFAGMGLFMKIVSYLSFCRWGMVALFSIELAPWYYGDPMHDSCCKAPHGYTYVDMLNGTALPEDCAKPLGTFPLSRPYVEMAMGENEFSYYAWIPRMFPHHRFNSSQVAKLIDIYPLPKLTTPQGWYTSYDAGFSSSAAVSLVIMGLVVRVFVYISLVVTDRRRRR